ncbi:MAG: dynamin family protein [Propioniciclava sp.]
MHDAPDLAVGLIAEARAALGADETLAQRLDSLQQRLNQPLVLAVAGTVKAGKSTLVNALVGARVAPTGESGGTRWITWYRHAPSPVVEVHTRDGRTRIRQLEARESWDRALAGIDPETVDHLEVGWPADLLRELTLVDTPGIDSVSARAAARARSFLIPTAGPSGADALLYVVRGLGEQDIATMAAFQRSGGPAAVNALVVLARADEIGPRPVRSLDAAHQVAADMQQVRLAAAALGVHPVAGLLGQGAATVPIDVAALQSLAALTSQERERQLASVDRFLLADGGAGPSGEIRARLLQELGLYGVRIAVDLVRDGLTDGAEVRHRLVRHAGVDDLLATLRCHWLPRRSALTSRAIAAGVAAMLPSPDRRGELSRVMASLERLEAAGHDGQELMLLSEARCGGLPLPDAQARAAARLVGGDGVSVTARLGMAEGTSLAVLREAAGIERDRWRSLSHRPLTDQRMLRVCRVVLASLERIEARLSG